MSEHPGTNLISVKQMHHVVYRNVSSTKLLKFLSAIICFTSDILVCTLLDEYTVYKEVSIIHSLVCLNIV